MRRVSEKRDSHLSAIRVGFSVSGTEMVFHISGVTPDTFLLGSDTLEFGEDLFNGLVDDVGENIKSSSMRHTNNTFLSAFLLKSINNFLKTRDEGFATFKTESLQGVELVSKEHLELMSPHKSGEVSLSLLNGNWAISDAFELVSYPKFFLVVLQVHVFNTDFLAVNACETLNELSKLPVFLLSEEPLHVRYIDIEFSLKISLCKSIRFVVENFRDVANDFPCST
jgi:hypothetical protein